MPLPKINPTTTTAWKKLENHFHEIKDVKMTTLFEQDSTRVADFSISWEDFYLDFSKNRISKKTKALLLQLAAEVNLKEAISAQFSGEPINETENRAVLHTALRDFDTMKPEVSEVLKQMEQFSEKIISGTWKGYSGKAIKTIVNIGVGGSDLGPQMVTEALQFYKNHLTVKFVSNVDGDHVMETLKELDPVTTLFIIVSKSFTTQETITNATTIRNWFLEKTTEDSIAQHFVAVSTNKSETKNFGIKAENTFTLWDWVGGRFSLWSAVGLSICCSVGYKNFENLLKGAHTMDTHFSTTEFEKNMPVILALISVWYNNFFKAETEAVLPYSQYLDKFVSYLQQANMESNGKSVDRNGEPTNYQTGTIVWGNTGTNAQHAFFQLMHQGTKLIPSDFICFKNSLHENNTHHHKLLANCFAQTESLLTGTENQIVLSNYKKFKGNKPSNTLIIDALTPYSLGGLIALYEHKLFVQGVIWNIFSYDQWGVELGKVTAKETLEAIESGTIFGLKNASTRTLINKTTK